MYRLVSIGETALDDPDREKKLVRGGFVGGLITGVAASTLAMTIFELWRRSKR